jgi:hypothetical protein
MLQETSSLPRLSNESPLPFISSILLPKIRSAIGAGLESENIIPDANLSGMSLVCTLSSPNFLALNFAVLAFFSTTQLRC